jgi:methionyl-tRNA formyltransferase
MRIVFLGTPAFSVPSLDALAAAGHAVLAVVCQPDRPAGREHELRVPETKRWAEARRVPVLQPEKVRDGKLSEDLAELAPDLLAVVAYGRILGKDLLALAPHGAVNVHASLLPKYRGAAPIQWAIAEGERETGVTVMQMDEGLDTGDILLQRTLAIAPEDDSARLHEKLGAIGGAALVEALALVEARRVVPVRQDPARATQAPILAKEHGRVDWAMPAPRILDRLRGFSPWPGAWTTLDGRLVKILAAAVEVHAPARPPGSAYAVAGRGLGVACGGGTSLLVTELQPEGRRRQAAIDFLNGLKRDAFVFAT